MTADSSGSQTPNPRDGILPGVVHLSTFDVRGSAARAAHRLHLGLRELGVDSRMLVARRQVDLPGVLSAAVPRRHGLHRLGHSLRVHTARAARARYAACEKRGYERFSDDRSVYVHHLAAQIPEECGIVNLHWVAGLVDYRSFFRALPDEIAIVWTLHDMNVFTGGCHYDAGCGRFTDSCGRCPQLNSRIDRDASRRIWERKRESFELLTSRRMRFVADSHWLAAEASRSSLLRGLRIDVIHYGLDLNVFRPRDRSFARSMVGLDPKAFVVLFVADSVRNRRKGFGFLTEALGRLEADPQMRLLSIGSGKPEVQSHLIHHHEGSVRDDRWLSLLYSAADVFVIPSIQEAFGQTALEAIACGTPVVGFDTGGIPDIVRPGETGVLVPAGDVSALAQAILSLRLDPRHVEALGRSGRLVAESEFGLLRQARDYASLYRELLGSRRNDRAAASPAGGASN